MVNLKNTEETDLCYLLSTHYQQQINMEDEIHEIFIKYVEFPTVLIINIIKAGSLGLGLKVCLPACHNTLWT